MSDQWLYDLLTSTRVTSEKGPDGKFIMIHDRDPLWEIFKWGNFLIVALMALFLLVGSLLWGWWVLWWLFPVAVYITSMIVVAVVFFIRVPATYIAARGLTDVTRYFSSCQLFIFPGFSETELFPFGTDVSGKKEKLSVKVLVPREVVTTDATGTMTSTTVTDLQDGTFGVQWTGQLDQDKLASVISTFDRSFREFAVESKNGSTHHRVNAFTNDAKVKIREYAGQIVDTRIDEFWSRQAALSAEEMTKQTTRLNTELRDFLNEPANMPTIGMKITSVGIYNFTGVWVEQSLRATEAARKAEADAGVSEADRRSRVAKTEAERAIQLAELETQLQVAAKQIEISGQQISAANLAAEANPELQALVKRLDLLNERKSGIVAKQLESLSPAQVESMWKSLADSLDSNVQTLVNVGANGEVGDIAPIIRLLRPLIDNLMKQFTEPPTAP